MNTPKPIDGFDRICRASGWMSTVIAVGIVIAVAVFVWYWSDEALVRRLALSAVDEQTPITLSAQSYWLFLAVKLGELAVYVLGLWIARDLFRSFARGEIFTEAAARKLRRLGIVVTAIAPTMIIARTAAVLALTIENPDGERVLAIGISGTDFAIAVIGILLSVIGWIMLEAARIAEENRQFV